MTAEAAGVSTATTRSVARFSLEANFNIVEVLRSIAEEVDRPMAQVALAWVANRPGVSSVLIGASRAEQLLENVASLDIDLSSQQLSRLERWGRRPC